MLSHGKKIPRLGRMSAMINALGAAVLNALPPALPKPDRCKHCEAQAVLWNEHNQVMQCHRCGIVQKSGEEVSRLASLAGEKSMDHRQEDFACQLERLALELNRLRRSAPDAESDARLSDAFASIYAEAHRLAPDTIPREPEPEDDEEIEQ